MRRALPSCISTSEKCILEAGRACKSQNHEQRKSKKEFRQRCKRRRSGGVVSYANQRATCSWLWPFHSKPLSAAPTVPCAAAAAIPGCMIPPAIPIISGYFIISGCSHNSDLNGVVWAGPPIRGTEEKKKLHVATSRP